MQVNIRPPLTDGGAAITSYKVDWDSDPGVHEVQTISTSVFTGPNEIQTITSSALVKPEVQIVTTSSNNIPEVQRILVKDASVGSRFFIQLDTSATGGSLQYSGFIEVNAPANSTRYSVEHIISALSNVDGSVNVTTNVIDANNYEYLVTFPSSMGNVPLMIPNTDELQPTGTAQVSITTVEDGNVLSGTFRLKFVNDTTADIPFDATEAEMTTALTNLPSIGSVTVSRSISDSQKGYSWTITFNDPMNSGNVADLTYIETGLKTSNPKASPSIFIQAFSGNQIGGTFKLSLTLNGVSNETAPINFNAEPYEMKTRIEDMHIVPSGSIAVTRSGPDGQLGYVWTVQFLDDYYHTFSGDLQPFVPIISGLTGVNSIVNVTETRKGTVKEVQEIEMTISDYNSSVVMSLQFQNYSTIAIPILPGNSTNCSSAVTEVQTITSSSVDTQATQSQSDGAVSHYLMFRLQYGEYLTNWINANPISDPGNCLYARGMIESELEKLPPFFNVAVTASSTSSSQQACKWSVTFVSSQGDLELLKVQAKNSVSKYMDPSFSYTSVVGDDSISTATLTNGKLDAIKAALELLPNVGKVTVNSVAVSSCTAGFACCTWKVTFDTKAGNLPSLLAAVYDKNAVSNQSSLSYVSSAVYANPPYVTNVEVKTKDGTSGTTHGTSSPIGGYFALEFRGARTGYISYAASARDLQQSLMVLDTIGDIAVTRSSPDENLGYTWSVTFLTELGDLSPILFDKSDLTGTVATGVVAKHTSGVFPPFNSLDSTNNLPLGSAVITNMNDLMLRVSKLEQGIAYYYRVSAINSVGQGPYGYSPIPFAIPEPQRPSSPSLAMVAPLDGTSVRVGFSSPPLDGGDDVTFYKIEYGSSAFVSEIQEVSVLCNVSREVQIVQTTTDHTKHEVQILHLSTTATSSSVVAEKQLVQCDATGGSFRLEFNGYFTPPISYKANAQEIKDALMRIESIVDVAVTFNAPTTTACYTPYNANGGFTVEFKSVTDMAGNLPLMTATQNSLGGLRRIEVTRSVVGLAPLGGKFRLSFMGSITEDINVTTLSDSILQTHLSNLDTIPVGGVNVTSVSLSS